MAEYNGVRIEPLSDGGQDLNYQVEQFIFWGAGTGHHSDGGEAVLYQEGIDD